MKSFFSAIENIITKIDLYGYPVSFTVHKQ